MLQLLQTALGMLGEGLILRLCRISEATAPRQPFSRDSPAERETMDQGQSFVPRSVRLDEKTWGVDGPLRP